MLLGDGLRRRRGAAAIGARGLGLLAVALAVVVAMTGCSSSKKDADGTPGSSAGSGKTTSTPSGGSGSSSVDTTDPAANAVKVVAVDQPTMAYQITGTPRPGLVSVTFDNQGDYAHEMTLQKFKDGATLDQIKAALNAGDPESAAAQYLEDPGQEITGPQIIGAHMSETVATNLTAGHYLVICFLPAPDGMTHAQMGMIGEFTVGGDAWPSSQVGNIGTITLTDKGITVPPALPSGGTFAVTNTGTKKHDFALAQLNGGSLGEFFQCVNASFGGGGSLSDCPGVLAGGVGTLEPGQTAYLTIQFKPGSYGYVSSENDGADFMAGLQGTFTVG
jgi:uncharacterized cupredoxin-like copper-binding protein